MKIPSAKCHPPPLKPFVSLLLLEHETRRRAPKQAAPGRDAAVRGGEEEEERRDMKGLELQLHDDERQSER